MGKIVPFQPKAGSIVPEHRKQVKEIKAQLAAGTFKIDVENLAKKLLDSGVLHD